MSAPRAFAPPRPSARVAARRTNPHASVGRGANASSSRATFSETATSAAETVVGFFSRSGRFRRCGRRSERRSVRSVRSVCVRSRTTPVRTPVRSRPPPVRRTRARRPAPRGSTAPLRVEARRRRGTCVCVCESHIETLRRRRERRGRDDEQVRRSARQHARGGTSTQGTRRRRLRVRVKRGRRDVGERGEERFCFFRAIIRAIDGEGRRRAARRLSRRGPRLDEQSVPGIVGSRVHGFVRFSAAEAAKRSHRERGAQATERRRATARQTRKPLSRARLARRRLRRASPVKPLARIRIRSRSNRASKASYRAKSRTASIPPARPVVERRRGRRRRRIPQTPSRRARAKRGGDRLGRHLEHRPARRGHERGDVRRRRVRRNHLHVVGHVRPRSRSRSLAGSERLCPAAISRRQSRDVRFPGTGASVDSPAESSPMPEIGARRFHHARLSRVLARPGRHARAPTDSTGTPGMPNSGGERTRKKKVCEIFGYDRGKRWEDGFFIMTFAGRSGRLALSAGIRTRARCDRFETPWGGSLGSSRARWRIPRSDRRTSRRTWWKPRRSARKCACGEICDTPGDRPVGWRSPPDAPAVFPRARRLSRRTPSSLTLSRLLRRAPRPQEEKLEPAHEDARVLGQGQDAEHCAYAQERIPRALTRAARRPSAFPRARAGASRALATPPERASGALAPAARRASARARPTASSPRDACPPEALPRRSLTPLAAPKSQKPQYEVFAGAAGAPTRPGATSRTGEGRNKNKKMKMKRRTHRYPKPGDVEMRVKRSRRLTREGRASIEQGAPSYFYKVLSTRLPRRYERPPSRETRLRFASFASFASARVSSAKRRTRRVSTTTSSPDSNATATIGSAPFAEGG